MIHSESYKDPRDGRVYGVIQVNGRLWMAQNLNFRTGSSSCYEHQETLCAEYGRLYDWETAKTACPDGWRLPANDEWQDLIDHLGGDLAAAPKLKSSSGWKNGGNGNNDSGFNANPAGYRDIGGHFYGMGSASNWWCAEDKGVEKAWSRSLFYKNNLVLKIAQNKEYGLSVRCIMD